jgi:cellulose synthase/poly-beta-1,6-N-acetylglucosamine synthase-like glycosyltransferase
MQFCADTFVAQQGLTSLLPFFRQRTRWIQGHYQCWQHLPALWRTRGIPLLTKLDLSFYLTMVTVVVFAFANTVLTVLGALQVIVVENNFLAFITDTHVHNLLNTIISFGPLLAFLWLYQARSLRPLSWWELPAYAAIFSFYCYAWVAATVGAGFRFALRRGGWVKTPRVAIRSTEA